MQEQDSSPTPLPGSKPKKRLDTVVKLALGVFVMSFTLIWGGCISAVPIERSLRIVSVPKSATSSQRMCLMTRPTKELKPW